MASIPVMRLDHHATYEDKLQPLKMQGFKALQYLELMHFSPGSDLAMLRHIPHIKLKLSSGTIKHSAGSWQSLEIDGQHGGFDIKFANIDAFVRDNAKYLFISRKGTKAWRSMRDSLDAACKRQGVALFKRDRLDEHFSDSRLSSIERMIDVYAQHLVFLDEFWPEACMWSCLNPASPDPKDDVTEGDCLLRRPRQLYDSSSHSDWYWESASDSESDFDSDSESETESKPKAGADSEMFSKSEAESGASLGPQSSVDLNDYCGALSEWEALNDLDRKEDVRQLPFWGCLTWQDATSTNDGAPYGGNPQLQALHEVCSFIGHNSREDKMTWNVV